MIAYRYDSERLRGFDNRCTDGLGLTLSILAQKMFDMSTPICDISDPHNRSLVQDVYDLLDIFVNMLRFSVIFATFIGTTDFFQL